ncbi:MAG: MBL fold metallo-hydrolase [Thermoplasmatota archaeon]
MRIERIQVPIGVGRGTANAWLLPDPPVTLVDCGPNLPATVDAIKVACRAHGVRLEDLEQIWITHGHVDHAGFAGVLSQSTGARVLVEEQDLLSVRDPQAWRIRRDREILAALVEAGTPPAVETELRRRSEDIVALSTATPKAKPYPARVIEGGGATFDVVALPGHTPGSVALHAPREKALFTGDAFLAKIVTGALNLAPRERGALGRHLASLEKLLALPPCTIYPGHGDPFGDHGTVIGRDLAHHARRSDRIRTLMLPGPRTAWQLVEGLFLGRVDPAFALSEVLGHLDLFQAAGVAKALPPGPDGSVRWALTPEGVREHDSETDDVEDAEDAEEIEDDDNRSETGGGARDAPSA